MARLVHWLSVQIDGRLSLAGSIYVLVLAVCGIGGGIAFATDSAGIAIALLVIFIVQISLLLLTALRTDPNLKLPKQERMAIWARAPTFLKVSLYVLVGGQITDLFIDTILQPTHSSFLGFAGAAASSFIFAHGVATHRPPLPRAGAEPLTFQSAPAEYEKQLASIKNASLLVGTLFTALVLLRLYH